MYHYRPHQWAHNPSTQRFIFATGIECSYPTIEWQGNPRHRVDQLELCGHYEHWREDLRLVRELGLRFLRYGPPLHRVHLGPGKYDWSFTDEVMPEIQRLGIVPIVDLCHFGVPDWIGNFQNGDWPRLFAEYAGAFAQRYPWVRLYTPVNEMYICAEFSAHYGWWNERLTSHQAFVTALKHLARACQEAMEAIIAVRNDALFVLAESSETTHANHPHLIDEAEFFNERRFLSMDLLCGRMISSGMYSYLRDNGMTEQEYLYFLDHQLIEHFVMGHDYYETNEHRLEDETTRVPAGGVFGYYPIARRYHDRYDLPIMHTETNSTHDQVTWLWKTFWNIQALRQDGIPVCGMTWYSLTHQMDWDTAMREANHNVYPVGLFDLDRNITPVGKAYQKLIHEWRNTPLLPNGPLTLVGEWAGPRSEPTAEDLRPKREAGQRDEAPLPPGRR